MKFNSWALTRWIPAAAVMAAAASIAPGAVGAPNDVAAHIEAAKVAAGNDYPGALQLCEVGPRPRANGPVAPPSPITREPAKVFDNLYYLGDGEVSSWAITTSAGIILIDALNTTEDAQTYIEGGMRALGLDPSTIRYIVIAHGHGDHYGGARYLADKYQVRVVMGDADWTLIETAPPRAHDIYGVPPDRDISIGHDDTLTLGDTRIELYQTPGHTPGTLSLVFTVMDRGRPHAAALWGGTGLTFMKPGDFPVYVRSTERFSKLVQQQRVDVILNNHLKYDGSFSKLTALASRSAGAPNPYVVGTSSVKRFLRVINQCARAQQAYRAEQK